MKTPWTLTDRQMRHFEEGICRFVFACEAWLKIAVIAGVLYLTVEIGVAFLPGGAVERVLGGVK